ncbi:hypothetical protein BG262_07945 [Floricoccus penangensis]|uniref:Voltage-gated chloride channel protein n=1 Tax=Floricoccus penangensis TaxID=1859475 RepID=A0A9Q5JI05_9LACT|nr:chloride channel protein [Floricoccus penangensis]OFI47914.1 hypothetical protein BG262_07945 [Floricoccus penangensis]
MKSKYFYLFILSIFALPIGFIIACCDALFANILINITNFRIDHFHFLIPFLALIGVVIVYCYQKYGSNIKQGMTLIFNAAFDDNIDIPLRLVPFAMISTWLTHLFGGSAGRTGVSMQIGATISSNINKFFKSKLKQKDLICIGIASGFTAMFQTPLAGAIFAVEVMEVGKINYQALIPCLIAAYTSRETVRFFGLKTSNPTIDSLPNLSFSNILSICLISIIFGIAGLGFSSLMSTSKKEFPKILPNPLVRVAVLGSILSLILFLAHQGRYSGLGSNLINLSFSGKQIYSYDFLLKAVLTILTLSIGYQGGEVTPLYSIGTSLGIILAPLFGLPLYFSASLGYAAVFSSASNTLIAPILIGAETFGFNMLPYYIISISISYICNFNKSIFEGQRSTKKVESLFS